MRISAKYIYVVWRNEGILVIDISDPANPTLVADMVLFNVSYLCKKKERKYKIL
ncbi:MULTISPECIES: hypothetical protein [unclassified Thermosipho (in: thermotogales)]|uniref:hypothetical protein n=1 Tax=unclassified Thermosipho (in: thermotogales) TaxID=2676525 RepID=UPI000987AEBA